jgi:hypothetical protein
MSKVVPSLDFLLHIHELLFAFIFEILYYSEHQCKYIPCMYIKFVCAFDIIIHYVITYLKGSE